MSTTARVGGFVLGLAAVAGAATALGVVVGPVETETLSHGDGHQGSAKQAPPRSPALPRGLMVSEDGYTLQVLNDRIEKPGAIVLRFRVTDREGGAVTAYHESHGEDLHLIVVRRDLTEFQHVHPMLGASGTWTVPLDFSSAGEYRVIADFRPEGSGIGYTLGHDVSVAGRYEPTPLPGPTRSVRVDGYEVRLNGDLAPGKTSSLTFSVTRDGVPVSDLQPYLGAYGHLVALRDHDLTYLHVHPEGGPDDDRAVAGPDISFAAEVPSMGDFRLFLDFRHDGQVHTAAFTLNAASARPARPTPSGSGSSDEPHDEAPHH